LKILTLADEESKYLWDYYTPGRLDGIDLMISCGDLKASYLSFLVTMGRSPLMYVHGNHDYRYDTRPPEGCDCIDDELITYKGLRILGLGGCKRYCGTPYQYSEKEMEKRIKNLKKKIKKAGGVDIIVTHAPPKGYGDDDTSYAHRGFEAFLPLIEEYKPLYLLHGHVHANYRSSFTRSVRCGDTQVVNCCERYIIEIPDELIAARNPQPEKVSIFAKLKLKERANV